MFAVVVIKLRVFLLTYQINNSISKASQFYGRMNSPKPENAINFTSNHDESPVDNEEICYKYFHSMNMQAPN